MYFSPSIRCHKEVMVKILKLIILLLIPISLALSCKEPKEEKAVHQYTNALINETSPYLLQHAHNPVDWRPWSEEVLEEARSKDKLVLVSIGYSSCHWCHVMEKETFEDENVAAIMNENFINIKVDREERPDVDQVYMTALQLIKGSGGWPLNVITLPDGKPIYGGTYHTNAQWKKVITEVSNLYRENPERAREYAEKVAQGVQEVNLIRLEDGSAELQRQQLEVSLTKWRQNWDLEWGGNQGRQKFILPSNLDFLLQYARLTRNLEIEEHVKTTLDRISYGGIYDHVGGGFFRYSTDPYWKVPHFEKMLYDNAQMLGLYAKAYKHFGDENFRSIVYRTFGFLEREMKHPDGGYYAALDADSEGEEGKYYIWTIEELKDLLGSEFKLFAKYYNIDSKSTWEENKFVLHKLQGNFQFAGENALNINDLNELSDSWAGTLLKARESRIRPGLDDKIITSWNALLIEGFVEAYKALGDPVFLEAAESTFKTILRNSFDGKYLNHSYKENSRYIDGFLDDYVYLTSAVLVLYEVTGNQEYLEIATGLSETVTNEFIDTDSGLYRYKRKSDLISKIVKINDGVLPSPNAVAFRNELKLGHIMYDTTGLRRVEKAIELLVPAIREDGSNYSEWSSLLLKNTFPYYEIAVVGKTAVDKAKKLHSEYLPNTLIVASDTDSSLPLFKDRFFEDDTYIFVCQNNSCKLPTTSVEGAINQLAY